MTLNRVPLHLSVQSSVQHWATYQPDKLALVTDSESFSYSVFYNISKYCQVKLAQLSLPRQTPVGILVEHKCLFLAALSAVLAEGHIPVLLNLMLDQEILRSMIRDAGCGALLVDSAAHQNIAAETNHSVVFIGEYTMDLGIEPTARASAERYVDDIWGIIYGIYPISFCKLNDLELLSASLRSHARRPAFIARNDSQSASRTRDTS